jgi:signal transduction histidine kinase
VRRRRIRRATLDELRQTVWAMKSEGEGVEALELKLHELKRRCTSAGRTMTLDVRREPGADVGLSSARLLNMYRIAQEAVQNSMKHAEARAIAVELDCGADALTLTVSDDGSGFDRGAATSRGGLENMEQRCSEAGGEFRLRSGAGGTEVSCRFAPE